MLNNLRTTFLKILNFKMHEKRYKILSVFFVMRNFLSEQVARLFVICIQVARRRERARRRRGLLFSIYRWFLQNRIPNNASLEL